MRSERIQETQRFRRMGSGWCSTGSIMQIILPELHMPHAASTHTVTHGHTLPHTATRKTCRSHPMRRESIPRRHVDGVHPNSNPFMTRLIPFLLPCILTLAHPAMADASSEDMPAANVRPLNLSLPREMLSQPSTNGVSDETMRRNLQAPARTGNGPEAGSRPSSLPYGAGYEHRQRNTQSPGSGGGTGGPGHGAGRRGR